MVEELERVRRGKMRKILAGIAGALVFGETAQACDTMSFDYSSFSRMPTLVDLDRVLAEEAGPALTVSLGRSVFQISPRTDISATQSARQWQRWMQSGKAPAPLAQLATVYLRPVERRLPEQMGSRGFALFGKEEGETVAPAVIFAFPADDTGAGIATITLSGFEVRRVGEVVAELAALMTFDPICVSPHQRYDGKFVPEEQRYIVFPVEAFGDAD